MDLHELIKPGIPWISSSPSLEFHGISQIMKGWSSMDFQLALSGIPWNFTNHQKLEFHGIPAVWAWISMEFHKSPEAGIPWNSMSRQMKIHGIPWRCLNSFFSTRIAKQVLIWYWYIVQSMLQRMRYEPSQSAIVGVRKLVPSPNDKPSVGNNCANQIGIFFKNESFMHWNEFIISNCSFKRIKVGVDCFMRCEYAVFNGWLLIESDYE